MIVDFRRLEGGESGLFSKPNRHLKVSPNSLWRPPDASDHRPCEAQTNLDCHADRYRASALASRGVSHANTAATANKANTSPQRWPMLWVPSKDCTAITPPCTTLDQTVNQIRLLWATGLRAASIRKTPSVA